LLYKNVGSNDWDKAWKFWKILSLVPHPCSTCVGWAWDHGFKMCESTSYITSGTLWGANGTCQPLPFLSYRERRETTELGYPGRCRRQPRKHRGPVPVHPWQRAWFMARDPGLRGEIGFRHRPGLILTPAVPHTWAPPGLGQIFFYRSSLWSLGVGTWDLDWSRLRTRDSDLQGLSRAQPAHAGHRHSQSTPLPFLPGRARSAGLAHPSSVTDGRT
jgi:hypothetical protein